MWTQIRSDTELFPRLDMDPNRLLNFISGFGSEISTVPIYSNLEITGKWHLKTLNLNYGLNLLA